MNLFKEKAQLWASSFSKVCILDSNGFKDPYGKCSFSIAIGSKDEIRAKEYSEFTALESFLQKHKDQYLVGAISYDYSFLFFVPETILAFQEDYVEIRTQGSSERILQQIHAVSPTSSGFPFSAPIKMEARMSRKEYAEAFRSLQTHLRRGDIYEINLCQEFFAETNLPEPYLLYKQLNKVSPNPFSSYFRFQDLHILCASPERFLAKRGKRVLSQPIKGTAPRGKTEKQDRLNKMNLLKSAKDLSENVMIVDLVRNDLAQIAEKGTVRVDELTGLYSFPLVHQLISTISCELSSQCPPTEVLQHTFPPGSMTGAPKLRAMELIKKFEKSKRGFYSGSIGYLSPDGDFDFNVIIRSLIYREKENYLSYHVGGAITLLSEEEEEYQECILKALGMQKTLQSFGTY